jgi:feruloyl esterase
MPLKETLMNAQRTLTAFLILVASAGRASAQVGNFENWKEEKAGRPPKQACADLRSETGYDFSVDTAVVVPSQSGVPEFCRAEGLIAPEVRFEVSLPASWNGRLFMFGNGGFAGESLNAAGRVAARNEALKRGFAVTQTNTGHEAAREPLATFAANPQKLVDYAYRAVHVTAMTARTLVRTYYGEPASKSYFAGCSTGGRQALISAQRFPEDFDGIVAGAPVLDFSGTMVQYAMQHRLLEKTTLPIGHLRIVADKIYQSCDATDGLRDGVIDDPRRCRFNPAADLPRCTEGRAAGSSGPGSDCFTDAQIAALEAVYRDTTASGTRVMPGWPLGVEVFFETPTGARSGWDGWFVSSTDRPPIARMFSETFFTHMATPGTSIDWRTLDPDRDLDKLKTIRSVLDATDPDLSRFRARGGKLLMYFGWADPALNPLMGVGYYERVRETMGRATGDFFRLFMMPGVFHCAGGVGPSVVDAVTPLVDWVERSAPPERLVASQRQQGKTVRTRPLCPYPMVAKYSGSGSVDDAGSFVCSVPGAQSSR